MFKKACLLALSFTLLQNGVNNKAYAEDKKANSTATSNKSGIIPLIKFDNDKDVNINLSNANVTDVLKALLEDSGYNLIVTSKITDESIPRIELKKMRLSEAFTLLLKLKNLGVKKIGKTIFIAESDKLNSIGLTDSVIKSYKISNMKPSEAEAKIKEFYVEPNKPPKIIVSDPTNTLAVVGRPSDIEFLDSIIPNVDLPIPQVMIEVKMIELSEDASNTLSFSYGFGQKQFGAAFNNSASAAGSTAGGGDAVKSSGVTLSFDALRDFTANFNASVNSLVSQGKAKILTSPRLATQNGKQATFQATQQAPIIKTTQTAVGQTQDVSSISIGETISVTPLLVDPSSGFVTLDIAPQISNRGKDVIVNGNPVPETLTRTLKTIMKTRSGESVILAGIKRKNNSTASSKIPFLGDIPFLGTLFGANSWSDSETEIIIMVTPYILDEGGKGGSVDSSSIMK